MMMLRTKLQTRLLALLLMLSLLLTTALFSSCQTVEPPESEDTTDAETTEEQTTEEQVVNVVGGKRPKIPNTVTLDENFADNKIVVGVQPYMIDYPYTKDDFAEVGCTEIVCLMLGKEADRELHIGLTLDQSSKQHVLDMIKILEKREDLYYAFPDMYLMLDGVSDLDMTLPNDPQFTDDDIKKWGIEKIMLPDAWDYTTGSPTVRVGIMDSGIDVTHPDLENRVNTSLSRDFLTDGSGLEDSIGHGTPIAGIIGAQGNNELDCVGVCWNVELVSLKVASSTGSVSALAAAQAISYAENNDIKIINASFSYGFYNDTIPVLERAIMEYSGLYICTAGNGNKNTDLSENIRYPRCSNFVNTIIVGASTPTDTKRENSNSGANTVDIFAPGENIYTTMPNGAITGMVGGTSFAAPYVAGVAALMLSYNPDLTPAQIKAIIMNTADTVYKNGENVFGDKCVSGGRLNAYEALHYVASHLEYHDSFVVSDSRNDPLEHDWVCSCGDRLEQRHSHTIETHAGSPVYHRLACICGDWTTTEAHTIKIENVNSIDYHKRSCKECQYISNAPHTWELNYVNPDSAQASAYAIGGGDASIQAIPVYTCSDCGYVSYTTPPDYGYN